MRILVYPVLMEIGGSQINAIELAQGAAEHGHDVVMFGPSGPLVEMVEDLGLEYVFAPCEHHWPSPRNIAGLLRLSRRRRIDLVHGYEWGPSLELAFGPHAILGTPLVTTVMSMQVSGFIARHAPLVVGTRELAEDERSRRATVELIEPPIDTARNAPLSPARSRGRFGFAHTDVVLAVVSRLSTDLGKLDGVLDAIDVVGRIGAREPVRLLVVGDGTGLPAVSRRAAEVNRRLGREAVSVAGGMLDPRDAYDAADIVLGMGSSAMKGMAFAKPLVVQGENGFAALLDASNLAGFLRRGWWGTGAGDGPAALEAAIAAALARRGEWASLGRLGRRVVEENYSLSRAVDVQLSIYDRAVAAPPGRAAAARPLALSAARYAKSEAAIRLRSTRATPGPVVPHRVQPGLAA